MLSPMIAATVATTITAVDREVPFRRVDGRRDQRGLARAARALRTRDRRSRRGRRARSAAMKWVTARAGVRKLAPCASAFRGSSSRASAEWRSSLTPSRRLAPAASRSSSSTAPGLPRLSRRGVRGGRARAGRSASGTRTRVVKVRKPTRGRGRSDCASGQVLIGFLEPLTDPSRHRRGWRERGVHAFAMESIPRITRAQPMDALSSQATVSGYKAVLIAAERLPRFFPMLMTAAGTVAPAKVLVLGAGVAGLQAIATAHRLGAVVSGFDVRPVVREQVESLGATFLDLGVRRRGDRRRLRARADGGGAAAPAGRRSTERIPDYDVVITTALIPGRPRAEADPGGGGRADAARLGDRRPRGRGRRELRADRAGRGRRARRGHDRRADEPPRDDAASTRASSTRATCPRCCSTSRRRASSRWTGTTRSRPARA